MFLLGTRADGSPTGWPMVGLYPGDALEFSTYGRSQKVRDLGRNPAAACVVAPADRTRALTLSGRCAVVEGRREPTTGAANAPRDVRAADGIAEGAQARMRSGKRVVLRFVPERARFVAGFAPDRGDDGD